MKTIMVMFDSLNRHFLPPYGCDWTHAPNFSRLAQRATTFDRSYVASMPCMPSRRDLHTGRLSFLHRSWGPLEPFDDSFVTRLRDAGIYTHLCSDHYHYWEDGGAHYHTKYNSWQFARGQEGDPAIGQVEDPNEPANINGKGRRQDWVNRQFAREEKDYPQSQTFADGLDFIERNHDADNWFLQIECFDPHEPFVSPPEYHELYPDAYDGPLFDWPAYGPSTETAEQVEHLRLRYAALLSMCDASLGRVLDAFDQHDLWEDTQLIVWTDHGFMLGEHGCLAKNWMPLYEEVSHTPFFVYDPRFPVSHGARRHGLTQPATDLAPTILDFFGQHRGPFMTGHNLAPVLESDQQVREAALFGYCGERFNLTDGRHVLYSLPDEKVPMQEFSLDFSRMRGSTALKTLRAAQWHSGFDFTQGCPVLALPGGGKAAREADGTLRDLLFDLEADPAQNQPLNAPEIEAQMRAQMREMMLAHDAPPAVLQRARV